MVTCAEPERVVSATDTAVIVTVADEGTVAGAVYRPALEMVPTLVFPPATLLTCQVTAVLVVLVTVAVKDCVPPVWTLAALVVLEVLVASVELVGLAALVVLGVPVASMTTTFTRAGWPLWAMFLLLSVMPAVFEELAFRGVIQSALERILNARDAWLIQAALFSVLHLSPLMFPSHFLMGLCFGYMRRRSRSIYPGMLLHACWNALVVLKELYL